MNRSQTEYLCAACGLGTLVAGPQAVSGGLLHQMWRVITTQGTFAIKQLNPAIMHKQPGMYDVYRLTERVARDMLAGGVPVVPALLCAGDPLQQVGDATYMLYAWVAGEVLSPGPVAPVPARQIGAITARMHMLDLRYPELAHFEWSHFHDDDWDMLTFQAADMGLPWTYPVRALMPRLLEWSRWYERSGALLGQTLVVSHRDLDQKNVIWQDAQTPRLIDWEAVGLVNPTMELVSNALSWSGQTIGPPDQAIFAEVMASYVQAGGVVRDPGITALHGYMGTWLGWLVFNMRRSLGELVSSEEERQIGMSETTATLDILRSIAEKIETWATWVDAWR